MADIRDFIGQTQYTKNPKHLPMCSASYASVGLKTGLTTAVALNASGVSATLATKGARAAQTVADTYVTVANLSAAGFLTNVVSPVYSGAGHTASIRLTVDGSAPVVISGAIGDSCALILGALQPGWPMTATTFDGHGGFPGGYYDGGFGDVPFGNIHQEASGSNYKIILTPHEVLSLGYPALRFEKALLVEVKSSLLSATIDPNRYGIALYRLDV